MSFLTPHTLIIAEIGTAHGGSLDQAKRLIDAAADAGADCVKFQIVYADEILHPDTGFVTLPGGKIRLYDRFKELETAPSFYRECADYCKKAEILFSASPFGQKSLKELVELSPSFIKIASPELNHFPLLKAASETSFPLVLSSGVSRLCDIEEALDCTQKNSSRAILHCITSYPAPETEYNLKLLQTLSRVFGIQTGVSDHSLNPVLVPVLSVAMGGCIIEKHICLAKTDGGLDDPVALPPADFILMVQKVREAEKMSGEECISLLKAEFGEKKIEQIIGTGIKQLAPSEKANYTRTNRSIHFMRSMKKGEIITNIDVSVLRTEKVLSPGLSPSFLTLVTGAVLAKDAQNGEGVTAEHLVAK